ncbi:hypothetical protein ABPG75_013723 [Micractinium tetrahymenae]
MPAVHSATCGHFGSAGCRVQRGSPSEGAREVAEPCSSLRASSMQDLLVQHRCAVRIIHHLREEEQGKGNVRHLPALPSFHAASSSMDARSANKRPARLP